MKKFNFKLYLIFLILLNNIIFAEYKIENNKVYYQEGKFQKQLVVRRVDDGKGKYKIALPDIKTFKALNSEYAVDKYTAYFQNNNIQDSDSKTFELLDDMGKDKNYVYINGQIVINEQTGKPLNLKNFTILKKDGDISFLKDKENIYEFSGMHIEKIEGVDMNSFEVMKNGCGRDKNNIYFGSSKLKNVDKQTFECIGSGFVKDKNGIYGGVLFLSSPDDMLYDIEKIENIDKDSFEIIGESYSGTFVKDKNNVYLPEMSEFKKVKEADPKTFELIDEFFEKDKNNLYFLGKKVKNVDKKEIETIYVGKKIGAAYTVFFKNKDGVYKFVRENPFDSSKDKLVKLNVDKDTLEVLNRQYYKDKNNVYCDDKILKNADLQTFEVVGDEDEEMQKFVHGLVEIVTQKIEKKDGITARDKNNKYKHCKVVK